MNTHMEDTLSRHFGLILIPGDTPEDQIFEAVYERLTAFMADENDPDQEYQFDYFVELDDYPPEEVGQIVFTPAELAEQFGKLEIESIVTPEYVWLESALDWDDADWQQQAQELFTRYPDVVGVKFLYHM